MQVCADCQVPLVEKLAAESDPDPAAPPDDARRDFVEVLTTFNVGDVVAIQNVLEGEGIAHFVAGANALSVLPGAIPARVMVREDQAEEAVRILSKLDLAFTLLNWDTDGESDLDPYGR